METVMSSLLDWGVATLTLPGQARSGDRHVVKPFFNGVLVAVVDGLGHGAQAAQAAETAVAALVSKPEDSLISLLRRCHESLRGTRGVVMSIASFNGLKQKMSWLGVGNVEGILLRADTNANPATETPILRGGVVGVELPTLQVGIIPVARSDMLILATDGIESGFAHDLPLSLSPQKLADHVLARHQKGTDDALVLVARYMGVT
jgi:serine/threonine protein phosphatase PrpC